MQSKVEVLLFDLGGVLVEFSGVRDVAPLMSVPASASDIRERWSHCPHTAAYCVGRLSRQAFGESFVRDWGLNLAPEQFLREFRSWSRRLLPGARELLEALRPRFRLAALSNSNELHWERHNNDLGVTDLFEVAISSHQAGCCKPDPGIYLAAVDRLGVSPEAVMFFDDAAANVEAAVQLGMRAFQVDGVKGVRERLIQERLL